MLTHRCYYWQPDSSRTQAKDDIAFFNDYFNSMENVEGFPFAIFCDHIPTTAELKEIFGAQDVYQKNARPYILIIKRKGGADLTDCWNMLSNGIDDVVEWTTREEITAYLEAKYERNNLIKENIQSDLVKELLVGDSETWKHFLYELIETTLFSEAPVLLMGESGTGKELISRLVHALDRRADKKKMVVVDCTTIVPELSGSELFGHERGAYTNAIQAREGAFALANGGTLFLDEIGELPMNLQAELLRVLQEGTYKKVGSNVWQKTNFRLVCATHRDLTAFVSEGRFRQDLFYRISDCQFRVPSLEERKDDIPLLVNHFLSKLFAGSNCPELDKPVLEYLLKRKYPGNIRELRQLIQRLALKHVEHKKITIGELSAIDRTGFNLHEEQIPKSNGVDTFIRKALLAGENWWNLKNKISETAIEVALDLESNNKQKAAERLGLDVRTVQQYVKKRGCA